MTGPFSGAHFSSTPVRCGGTAAVSVATTVTGPQRLGRVLHPGAEALYLEVEGACLGLLTASAVGVPCGIRTQLRSLPPLRAGDRVAVGGGSVVVPGLQVVVTGIVDSTVPVLGLASAEQAVPPLERLLGDRLSPVRDVLPLSALQALGYADPAAVPRLLGLGPGLTPLGDDVICGWLATAVATRHPGLAGLRQAVLGAAAVRTTALSATLLACAARGEALPELRSLLSGMAAGNAQTVSRCVEELLGVGGSSGAGLLLGALIALQSLLRSGAPA